MMATIRNLALAAVAATTLASCYYDPYGGGYTTSGSYGYSGGTTFIHTSSDRWFYDSSVRCYYDRHRRSYYDPFLGGYYPAGYCPRPIYHAPHPYGWNGHGTCPVPRNVTYINLSANQDRLALLRARNHTWAHRATIREDASVDRWRRDQFRAASNWQPNQPQPQGGGRPGGWGQQQVQQPPTDTPRPGFWGNRPQPQDQQGGGNWGNRPQAPTQGGGSWGQNRPERPGFQTPVNNGGGMTPPPAPQPPPAQTPPPAPANDPPLNQRQQRIRDFADQFR